MKFSSQGDLLWSNTRAFFTNWWRPYLKFQGWSSPHREIYYGLIQGHSSLTDGGLTLVSGMKFSSQGDLLWSNTRAFFNNWWRPYLKFQGWSSPHREIYYGLIQGHSSLTDGGLTLVSGMKFSSQGDLLWSNTRAFFINWWRLYLSFWDEALLTGRFTMV